MGDPEYLSSEALEALIKAHRDERIFLKDAKKATILAPWLLELRSRQARYAAEQILGEPIPIIRWEQYWIRSTDAASGTDRSQTPNTATFGGYRQKPARFTGTSKRKKGPDNRQR